MQTSVLEVDHISVTGHCPKINNVATFPIYTQKRLN